MNKPNTLRAALVAAIPSLATDPDKLLVFIDNGHVISTNGAAHAIEYQYVLNVMLLDFAGDANAVMFAITQWVMRYQNDLLANEDSRKAGISFEADHLNQSTVDLSIKLNVTESVTEVTDAAGKKTYASIADPVPEYNVASFVV